MVDDRRPTLNLVLITPAAQPVDLLHGLAVPILWAIALPMSAPSISNLAVKFPEFHGFLRFSQSPETGNRETGKLTHGKNSSYLKSPN